ncbi:MAG: hypothetical protein HC895_09435 [Leptolyngbyaceae cyanobacterium SM1_3_5]|nr:hypothetical protein [Leptolyngbyaceae cyanobacterium SM1_3_5]
MLINLFTGYAVAALGFSVSLLKEASFTPKNLYAYLYLASIFLFGISILLGSVATVTRLLDFQATAQKIKHRRDRAKAHQMQESHERSRLSIKALKASAGEQIAWAQLLGSYFIYCLLHFR